MKSEAESCALGLLDGCLAEAISFKPFIVKVTNPTRGKKAKDLAVSLREKIKENVVGSFASECVRMMWKSVTAGDKCKTLSSNREEMMKSFHKSLPAGMSLFPRQFPIVDETAVEPATMSARSLRINWL